MIYTGTPFPKDVPANEAYSIGTWAGNLNLILYPCTMFVEGIDKYLRNGSTPSQEDKILSGVLHMNGDTPGYLQLRIVYPNGHTIIAKEIRYEDAGIRKFDPFRDGDTIGLAIIPGSDDRTDIEVSLELS
jgi:hypothetical protein